MDDAELEKVGAIPKRSLVLGPNRSPFHRSGKLALSSSKRKVVEARPAAVVLVVVASKRSDS